MVTPEWSSTLAGGALPFALEDFIEVLASSDRLFAAGERGVDCVLSTAGNSYDADYFSDSSKAPEAIRKVRDPKSGPDWDETMFNVFRLDGGAVRHFWSPSSRGRRRTRASTIDPATPRALFGVCST
jgi:hypothetical protein